jgi:hypothetical protein
MALSKRQEFGKIEVLPDGQIQLREDRVIEEDGVEVARTYRRSVLEPSATLPTIDPRVRAIANAIWTPTVVAAYLAKKAEPIQLP